MGITHRDDELPDAELVGVAEVDLDEIRRVGTQDGQIRERVATDHLEPHLPSIGKGRPAPLRSRHHVRRREHVAVGGERDATPRPLATRAATLSAATDGTTRSATVTTVAE